GELGGKAGISVSNPKLAFALVLDLFHPSISPEGRIHPTAVIGEQTHIEDAVTIQAHAVVGNGVCIGKGTVIEAGAIIADGVTVGQQCLIGPNVVLYRQTHVGSRVRIHGGSVIGGDGFGYVFHEGRHVKVPQVGNVIIEDDVEIGCNVCVDRATIGSTLIKRGTKIDNLVQIGHNNHIGQHVIITGQGGFSGSVTVGDYAVFGGRAGVTDHVTIGERAQVGLCSVVTKSVPPGEVVLGYPARPIQDTKHQLAALARLPAFVKHISQLLARLVLVEKKVSDLEQQTHAQRRS
ncbi:MAG: UDP-3-O-(3-hydroxymyristoyl)glucosamine N-acyltransferase, partial [Candidatus Omnitrophica bacterium]|nr:UDP-3-O-(3-hydroxymyristoyl)glucosamine N-acyltransferase [Candidatus Omnitrophota bacterium]